MKNHIASNLLRRHRMDRHNLDHCHWNKRNILSNKRLAEECLVKNKKQQLELNRPIEYEPNKLPNRIDPIRVMLIKLKLIM